jgi:serine/threonine protein kinase
MSESFGNQSLCADFGLAKQLDDSTKGFKTLVGTPQYFAPEVILEYLLRSIMMSRAYLFVAQVLARQHTTLGLGTYDVGADMWSIGVILYVMLRYEVSRVGMFDILIIWCALRSCNFPSQDPRVATKFNDCPAWRNVSPDCKDFIASLLVVDPKTRLSSKSAMQHRWFAGIGNGNGNGNGNHNHLQVPNGDVDVLPMELTASTVSMETKDIFSPNTARTSISTLGSFPSSGGETSDGAMDETSRNGYGSADETTSMHVSMSTANQTQPVVPMELTQMQSEINMKPARTKTVVGKLKPIAEADDDLTGGKRGKNTNGGRGASSSNAAAHADSSDLLKRPRRSVAHYN